MPPAAKTVGSVLAKVKELKQRSAIQHTLVQILRTRFLPSDGVATPLAQISCEGAPVSTDVIEEVVEELHAMSLAAAAHIVERNRFADLGITDPRLAALVAESWRRRAELPSVYGRFDLRYDGSGPAGCAGARRPRACR